MSISANVNSVNKEISEVKVNIGGVWTDIVQGWARESGDWKQIYSSGSFVPTEPIPVTPTEPIPEPITEPISYIAYDYFDRANATTIGRSTSDDGYISLWGSFGIDDNKLYPIDVNSMGGVDCETANHSIEAELYSQNLFGLVFRGTPNNEYYHCRMNGNTLELSGTRNGINTIHASKVINKPLPIKVRIEAYERDIRVFVDDVFAFGIVDEYYTPNHTAVGFKTVTAVGVGEKIDNFYCWATIEPSIKFKPEKFIYTDYEKIIAYDATTARLYFSEDEGKTFNRSMYIPNIYPIKYIHMFQNGNLMICTHNEVFFSTDLITMRKSTLLDENGNPIVLTGRDYFAQYQLAQQDPMMVDGVEVLMWGNFSNLSEMKHKQIYLWYTADQGRTVKVAYQFRSEDEPDNEVWSVAHIHSVAYNPADETFWVMTGDFDDENMLIKATYNLSNDEWTWNVIGVGYDYKLTNMVFWEDYVYWAHDVPGGGIVKCLYDDAHIADKTKHQKLMSTNNDTLDLIISKRGEFIVLQTVYGGGGPPWDFWYSPDRVNFHYIRGQLQPEYRNALYMSVHPPTKSGHVLAGIIGSATGLDETAADKLAEWSLQPGVYLTDYIRAQGFPNAFVPSEENVQ